MASAWGTSWLASWGDYWSNSTAAPFINSANVALSEPQLRVDYSEPQRRVVYSDPETRSAGERC